MTVNERQPRRFAHRWSRNGAIATVLVCVVALVLACVAYGAHCRRCYENSAQMFRAAVIAAAGLPGVTPCQCVVPAPTRRLAVYALADWTHDEPDAHVRVLTTWPPQRIWYDLSDTVVAIVTSPGEYGSDFHVSIARATDFGLEAWPSGLNAIDVFRSHVTPGQVASLRPTLHFFEGRTEANWYARICNIERTAVQPTLTHPPATAPEQHHPAPQAAPPS